MLKLAATLLVLMTLALPACSGTSQSAPGSAAPAVAVPAASPPAEIAPAPAVAPAPTPMPTPVADRVDSAGDKLAGGLHVKNGVDYGCERDADCEVKNVGNCCGYYPACVNTRSPTFPEQVKAQCAADGVSSVCGFPEIGGCQCVEGRCESLPGPGGAQLQ